MKCNGTKFQSSGLVTKKAKEPNTIQKEQQKHHIVFMSMYNSLIVNLVFPLQFKVVKSNLETSIVQLSSILRLTAIDDHIKLTSSGG